MKHLIALAILKNGQKRIRSLVTYEVLYETCSLKMAQTIAEAEAQKLGSTGYTWVSDTIDRILAKQLNHQTAQDR